MNLYLFPEAACNINGYGFAVKAAYERLKIVQNDVVVWYTSFPKEKMMYVRPQDYIIKRPSFFSYKSVVNTIRRTNRSEIHVSDLNFLKNRIFDNIYCDETCFYHAIRKLFPNQRITVRFHNSFARIHDRLKLLDARHIDFLYSLTLKNMYRLERDVMRDSNVYKIFLSDEDRSYYTSHYGKTSDSEVFYFVPDINKTKENRNDKPVDHRLIWYGGVESHKKSSIDWFISDVLPKIKDKYHDVEFHLWGRGTEQFDDKKKSIFGHGFYQGEGNPSDCSLYLNPDIIGGGVKIKLLSLMESGARIISTPFGFEGYKKELIDDRYCIVAEEGKWADTIIIYLQKHSKEQ